MLQGMHITEEIGKKGECMNIHTEWKRRNGKTTVSTNLAMTLVLVMLIVM